MTIITVRRSALGACVTAIALLAGCGAQDSAAPASGWDEPLFDIARGAPDVTRAAGSSRYEVELVHTMTGDPMLEDGTSTVRGTGTYDFARQIGDGEYSYSGDQPLMQWAPQEVVFTNNVSYQRDIGAERWEKLDLSSMVDTPIGQHDPSQQLDLLRGVSEEIREVGTTQVRDTEVRQYAITIDPQRLAEASGVVVDGSIVQSALRATGPMPGQVFVDADGRVRRFEVRIETSGADVAAMPELEGMLGGDASGVQERLQDRRNTIDVRIDFFDFGVPVTAQEPDPSMVDPWTPDLLDMPELPELAELPELPDSALEDLPGN